MRTTMPKGTVRSPWRVVLPLLALLARLARLLVPVAASVASCVRAKAVLCGTLAVEHHPEHHTHKEDDHHDGNRRPCGTRPETQS